MRKTVTLRKKKFHRKKTKNLDKDIKRIRFNQQEKLYILKNKLEEKCKK